MIHVEYLPAAQRWAVCRDWQVIETFATEQAALIAAEG